MKKYVAGLVAIFAVIAAFAFIPQSKSTVEDPLYWFDATGTSYDGHRVKGNIATSNTQINHTGCDGDVEQAECERGFTVDKLLNAAHPEYGVDPDKLEQYTDMIFVEEN